MSRPLVYVALSEFCKHDDRPRRALVEAGLQVEENRSGRRLRRDEMPETLQEAHAVIAGVEPYDGELLASLRHLRCISRCGVGTDTIDLETAKRLDIRVLTTADEVVEPVAQMTVGMILALARNFPQHCADSRAGEWVKHTGYLLSEWTIGLIGFGRIGREVARCLQPFRPRIIVTDPYLRADQLPEGIELKGLKELLAETDLVSLHAVRSPDQGPILGRKEIEAMKTGSRIVNTARGYLVDEAALYDSLRGGKISAAAVDVFQHEPYAGPLTQLPQVLCTPHVASLTRRSRIVMEVRCARNVVDFFTQSRRLGGTCGEV